MSIETEIPEKFPSLCYGCQNARKPAADSNRLIGWVGCTQSPALADSQIRDCDNMGEGWVDLRSRVFGDSSGVTTNCRLLTFQVRDCKSFQKLEP